MNFHKFLYDGRMRTIRQKTDTASWFLREKIDGKLIQISCNTHNVKDAERAARDFLKGRREGRAAELRALLRERGQTTATPITGPTIGAIVEAYKIAPQGPLERTRRENITCLRYIIHQVYGPERLWTGRPVADLNASAVRTYKRLLTDRARNSGASEAETERHKRTANSTLRQARAIFCPVMLEHYKIDCGFAFDNAILNEFRSTPAFVGLRKMVYQQPDDQHLALMLAALEQIRTSEPDIYLICWLGLTFGLRKSE